MSIRKVSIIIISAIAVVSLAASSVNAIDDIDHDESSETQESEVCKNKFLDPSYLQLLNNNGILPLSGNECGESSATACSASSIGSITDMSSISLPAQTISKIKAITDEFLERNKSAYMKAQQETGVPWQMIAALHFREAGMNPVRSIANGQMITGRKYKSIDGVYIGANLGEDAVLAAEHFIEMANMVYGIDITKGDLSVADMGNAFLAYNRGFLYKRRSLDYTRSGYVMQGIDEKHIGGDWIYLDPFGGHSKSRQLKNGDPGALAVIAYLTATEGNSTDISLSSDASSACTTDDISDSSSLSGGGSIIKNVVVYYQHENPWRNQKYGIGTISACGCGPSSLAGIVSTFYPDKQVNPKQMADFFVRNGGQMSPNSCGSYWIWQTKSSIFRNTYGISITSVTPSAANAKKGLSEGGLVLLSVGSATPFTSGGHIMFIRGVTDSGNFLVGDSNSRTRSTNENGFAPSVFKFGSSNGTRGMWIVKKV